MTDVDLTPFDERVNQAEQTYADAAKALCEAAEARIVATVRSFYPTAARLWLTSYDNEDGDLRLEPLRVTGAGDVVLCQDTTFPDMPDPTWAAIQTAVEEDLLWLADLRGTDWDNSGPFISTR